MEQKTYNKLILIGVILLYLNIGFSSFSYDLFGNTLYNGSYNGSTNADSTKVNKSGDVMSGILDMGNKNIQNTSNYKTYISDYINFSVNRTYTGTANGITQFSQSSSVVKFIVTGNDLTGGHNFRVNMNPDQSQQDTSKAGYAIVMKPYSANCAGGLINGTDEYQINRAIPNTINLETILNLCMNTTVYIPQQKTKFRVQNLSGSGNAYVCVDSNGNQYRGSPTC